MNYLLFISDMRYKLYFLLGDNLLLVMMTMTW